MVKTLVVQALYRSGDRDSPSPSQGAKNFPPTLNLGQPTHRPTDDLAEEMETCSILT